MNNRAGVVPSSNKSASQATKEPIFHRVNVDHAEIRAQIAARISENTLQREAVAVATKIPDVGLAFRQFVTESVISNIPVNELVGLQIENIFATAEARSAEDDSDDDFSSQLLTLIDNRKNDAVFAIEKQLQHTTNSNIVIDALSALGRSKDEPSRLNRLDVLCSFLSAPAPRTRYGAISGLLAMRDKSVLKQVKNAREREKIRVLQGVLDQLIEYLNTATG